MGLYDFTLYDVICRNATLYSNQECMVFNDIRLSFGAFKEKCDGLAAGLVASGIGLGDRLGVVAHNADEFMILYGAAAKIGAIVLPVNWRFKPDEMDYVLNDCTPKIVFAGPDYRTTVSELVKHVPSVEKCVAIGGPATDGFIPFDDLYGDDDHGGHPDIPADAGFVIIHTAAVEGRSRGALLSQANLIHADLIMLNQYHLTPSDCHIGVLPLFHIAGLTMTLATMHAGGKNVILERFDPGIALQQIEKEKGTLLFNFAPILKMIVDRYDESPTDVSSMRHISGLDHPENIQRFMDIAPETTFWSGFGQTEAMGVSSCPMREKPGSAGRPSPLSNVALFDDYDNEVPVGTPGEICVRSPTVFLGYWGRDADTADTFRNGWHHTGDVGRFDEEGYLWYVKRKAEKELIKPGGENVYPVEVEKAILDHDAVEEVCVIGVSDVEWGEAIKAICIRKAGHAIEAEDLIEFVASKIARYKKPKHVVFVDALPKTADGGIDRDRVKKDHGGKY